MESGPTPNVPSSTALFSQPSEEPSNETAEYKKEEIVLSVHRAMAKRKAVQAMGESSPECGSSQIGRRIMQRRGFARLIFLIYCDLGGVVVIPNDDMQYSEGYRGASKHPIVSVITLYRFYFSS